MFPFKDQIKEKTSQSFKNNCKKCNVDYIGKTERILVDRLKEHQKKKQTTNKSACYEHIKENPTHEMDYENIKVIDRARSNFKLRMKELLHILKEQPELNKQLKLQRNYNNLIFSTSVSRRTVKSFIFIKLCIKEKNV